MDAEHLSADMQRIVQCAAKGCCNGDCREGRGCPLRNVHTQDGGHSVHGALVFPTVDRAETMPQRFRLQPQPKSRLLTTTRWIRFAAVVVFVLGAAAVQIFGGKS